MENVRTVWYRIAVGQGLKYTRVCQLKDKLECLLHSRSSCPDNGMHRC